MSKIIKPKLNELYGLYVNCKDSEKRLKLFSQIVSTKWSKKEIEENYKIFEEN